MFLRALFRPLFLSASLAVVATAGDVNQLTPPKAGAVEFFPESALKPGMKADRLDSISGREARTGAD